MIIGYQSVRWPSGLRRQLKVLRNSLVRKGVGSNPTLIIILLPLCLTICFVGVNVVFVLVAQKVIFPFYALNLIATLIIIRPQREQIGLVSSGAWAVSGLP